MNLFSFILWGELKQPGTWVKWSFSKPEQARAGLWTSSSLHSLWCYCCVWVTHVCYTSALSILTRRSTWWIPRTCLCSCTLAHTNLEHIMFFGEQPVAAFTSTSLRSTVCLINWLTLLTPFSLVAFRAGAHVVPHTLTSILTGRAAHGWNTTTLNYRGFGDMEKSAPRE